MNEQIARTARAWLPTIDLLLPSGGPQLVTSQGYLLEALGQAEDAKRLYRTAADAGDRMGFYALARVGPLDEFLEWAIRAMETDAPAAVHAHEWIEGLRDKGIIQ